MRSFRQLVEQLVYRIAGLPVAIRELPAIFRGKVDDPLRHSFANRYWRPDGVLDWLHIGCAVFAWPLALLLASAWFTARNGPLIRERSGKSLSAQFREQIRLYFLAGVLPPWYYIFSLHQDGNRRANSFIHRFEASTFKLLRPTHASPLNDKAQFAEFCIERGIRCIGTAMLLYGSPPVGRLPD
jgi:hypothetical protein